MKFVMTRAWAWAWARRPRLRPRPARWKQPWALPLVIWRPLVSSEPRWTLADRLRSMLPPDAVAEPAPAPRQHSTRVEAVQYETEVVECVQKVEQGLLRDACEQLVASVPLHVTLPVLVERLLPAAEPEIGLYELTLALVSVGQRALATQLLEAQSVDKHSAIVEVQTAIEVAEADSEAHIDAITTTAFGYRFPQLLHRPVLPVDASGPSRWLRARMLARMASIDQNRFSVILQRWGTIALNDATLRLLLRLEPTAFESVVGWLRRTDLGRRESRYLAAVIQSAHTPRQFQYVTRPLYSRLGTGSLDASLERCMLRQALRLDVSYEIANIAARAGTRLGDRLLGAAVLSVAWALPAPAEPDSALVVGATAHAPVTRIWNALVSESRNDPDPSDLIDAVLNHAVLLMLDRLQAARANAIPGRILWTLLLSLPDKAGVRFGRLASIPLTRAMLHRPYLEQMRYMALPQTPPTAIAQLVQAHVARSMRQRHQKQIDPLTPHDPAEIQLIMAGLVLLSEKSPSTSASNDLVRLIGNLFRHWNASEAATLVATLHKRFQPAPQAVVAALTLLVDAESYTAAYQLLRDLGPTAAQVPIETLEQFVLAMTRQFPLLSHNVVAVLAQHSGIHVSPRVLRKMAIILCGSAQLTESQVVNRVQKIRRILKRTSGTGGIGARGAAVLVTTLMHRAIHRGGGSWRRLSWALTVARNENVSPEQFMRWDADLSRMRDRGEGYFAGRAGTRWA